MIYHKERLDDVHPRLAAFILTLIHCLEPHWPDRLIVCGWRGKEEQHAAFLSGASQVDWPNGAHNAVDNEGAPCSLAVDLSPYPNDAGKDVNRLYIIIGYAMALADRFGYKIRFGGDWNSNLQTLDQKLHDPWHFEIGA